MRVSSNTLFDGNVAAMSQQQARLLQTQQQVATGRKILTASDNPVAAARALELAQSDAMNTQYATTARRRAIPCRWPKPHCKVLQLCCRT